MKRTEYRVVWKREGLNQKWKRYVSLARAQRFMTLLGDEPWKAYAPDRDPDELECCAGTRYDECGCGGVTIRENAMARRADLPKMERVHLEVREAEYGDWRVKP